MTGSILFLLVKTQNFTLGELLSGYTTAANNSQSIKR